MNLPTAAPYLPGEKTGTPAIAINYCLTNLESDTEECGDDVSVYMPRRIREI